MLESHAARNLSLSAPQHIFLNELDTKFRAYVGGFGSGKTYVGCLDQLIFNNRVGGTVQGYFGPTYPSIRDIFYPTMAEAAESMKIRTIIKTSDKEVDFVNKRGKGIGKIICRSMDRPESIIGFKIARALVDEIDTMPMDRANTAWNKVIARMRLTIPGTVNGVGVTCTPEGYSFVYHKFKKDPTASYSMVQASTYENEEYLPEDYIESLLETYPAALVEAYINGEFVNLQSGSVYYTFNRQTHHSSWVPRPSEPIHVGMDFNVFDMCASAHIKREGKIVAIDEFFGLRDTPDMCDALKEAYPDHQITIYPDASGKGTSSKSASLSDIKILKDAKFNVKALNKNPLIKNRVASVNKQFEKGKYLINTDRCPELTLAFEQQAYDRKTGQPEKDGHLDNRVDGPGYLIHYLYPIAHRSAKAKTLGGM